MDPNTNQNNITTPSPEVSPVAPQPVNPEATYGTQLGGVLSYMRTAALLGAIGMIILTPFILITALGFAAFSGLASMLGYVDTGIISIIKAVTLVAMLVFAIIMEFRVAAQIKNRNYKVYDTLLVVLIVYLVYGIIDSFLRMSYYFDDFSYYASSAIPSFIFSIIWSILYTAISIALLTAYFSKSKRVFAWFNTRPVQFSKFYGMISKLPSFITNEQAPDFSNKTATPPPAPAPQQPVAPTPQAPVTPTPTPETPAQQPVDNKQNQKPKQ